jgi:3-hydroxyacyl-CoA dehydrogenase
VAVIGAAGKMGSGIAFTNTSSIPIADLNRAASLDGVIIGLHFYNPPAVQKLIEIIPMVSKRMASFNITCSLMASTLLKRIAMHR